MDPNDVCRCGHVRAFHDTCSRCVCPWFIADDNPGAVKRWKADRVKFAAQERRREKLAGRVA